MLDEYIRNRLLYFMQLKNISIYRMTQLSGLPESTVYEIFDEDLHRIPMIPSLRALCSTLGINLNIFFADLDPIESHSSEKASSDADPGDTLDDVALLDMIRNLDSYQRKLLSAYLSLLMQKNT